MKWSIKGECGLLSSGHLNALLKMLCYRENCYNVCNIKHKLE